MAEEKTNRPKFEKLLTIKEVAEWLQVTPDWVRSHANGKRSPLLPSVKLGRNVRFRREDIEEALHHWNRNSAA